MLEDEAMTGQAKPKYSKAAVASFVLGWLFCLPVGVFAVLLGFVGLRQTRKGRLSGRSYAKWGIGLGILSIWLTFVPFPAAFLQPPILQEDRALQGFLDDIAAERFQQAYENPTLGFSRSEYTLSEFTEWARFVNDRYGRGRIVCSTARCLFVPDPAYFYCAHFENVGFRTFTFQAGDPTYGPKEDHWFIVGFDDFPPPRCWMERKRLERLDKELTDN